MPSVKLPAEHLSGPKWIGRLRVLDMIRHHAPIARIDISRATGLSPATVTAITADLAHAGMIQPADATAPATDPKRGRPRATLKLCPQAATVAGLKVGTDAISVMLTDFEGTQIGQYTHNLPQPQLTPLALCDQISAAVRDACAQHGKDARDLAGAMVGLAGYVDGNSGFVHWSSSLTERSVDLHALLEQTAPCPVFIENDVNLVAKAEHLFGLGKHLDSFLVVTVEHGIGLGIVIDGALHRGARGCGAELGHTKVTAKGPKCQCGQVGCLEAYAGEYALVSRANALHDKTAYSEFTEFCTALDTDQHAQTALFEAQQFFAMGLANLVNLFDPQEIIIASKIGEQHPLCAPAVLAAVEEMVVQVDHPMPKIRLHGWGDLMWAHGAAAQALEEVSARAVKAA